MENKTYRILGGHADLQFTDEEIRDILKNLGYTIEMGKDTVEVPYGFGHIVKEIDCEVAYKDGLHSGNYLRVFNKRMQHLSNRFWKELSEDEYVKVKLKGAILNCRVDKDLRGN